MFLPLRRLDGKALLNALHPILARELLSSSVMHLRPSKSRRIWLAIFICSVVDTAAQEIQTPEQIASNARIEGERQLAPLLAHQRLKIGPVDARLKVHACSEPLQSALAQGTKMRDRVLVEVSCHGTPGWRTFVPVRVVGTRPAVILTHAVLAGQILKAEDLQLIEGDSALYPLGYFDLAELVVGLTTNRALAQGTIVSNQMLSPAHSIVRGQQVVLLADSGGFKVRMAGRALSDAHVNQRIRVQNNSSGRVVEGIARSEELVEIISP